MSFCLCINPFNMSLNNEVGKTYPGITRPSVCPSYKPMFIPYHIEIWAKTTLDQNDPGLNRPSYQGRNDPPIYLSIDTASPSSLSIMRREMRTSRTLTETNPPTKAETTHPPYWPKRTSKNYPGPKRPGTRIGYRAKYNLSCDWFTQR